MIPTGPPIDGSTSARSAPKTTGNGNLPEPVTECPADEPPPDGADAS